MSIGPGGAIPPQYPDLDINERWRLLIEVLRQQYANQAQGIRNSMDAAQANQYLGSTRLNFAGDRSQQQLRELSMQGDLGRQQQSNNRYGWGLDQDILQTQNQLARSANQELPSAFERGKRMLGY